VPFGSFLKRDLADSRWGSFGLSKFGSSLARTVDVSRFSSDGFSPFSFTFETEIESNVSGGCVSEALKGGGFYEIDRVIKSSTLLLKRD